MSTPERGRSAAVTGTAATGTTATAVVATAGHVDHGKSSLVRRLTGTEPDTLAEERRRGLTIELGHVHATLPSGRQVSVVDAPGHEDFLGTTVHGLAAAGAALLVVAADEGWSPQTQEHAGALVALGLPRVVLVVTKSDLADPAGVLSSAAVRMRDLGLEPCDAVALSTRTGRGWGDLLEVLERIGAAQRPGPPGPARMWVDRSFSVRGAGTVVTGTLARGRVVVGDHLYAGGQRMRVRGLQHHGRPTASAQGPARLAVNLAGTPPDQVPRGTLLTADPDPVRSRTARGRLVPVSVPPRWPRETLVSVGTTTLSARLTVREGAVRLGLPQALALEPGDRVVVRDPGGRRVLAGVALEQPGGVSARDSGRSRRTPAAPDGTGVRLLLEHLAAAPLAAPHQDQLAAWEVTPQEVRDLAAAGRVLHLGRGLVLHRDAAARAWQTLAALDQPFTTSAARIALGASRRVTVALLEHLDARQLTSRTDAEHRRILRTRQGTPTDRR
ncbi:selenocysteine-specific translation elongation factor [Ornithinimicrobium sediminis]|uniref:selenocysteine-specific translation elongation factor n=1 Tax=Ornithinimicrobium sediminis TaxID=2904603 RepID=UPI001E5C0CDF|nr:SelB C-terminal domain-containing protein [Ornithinimicrobium sediminis]